MPVAARPTDLSAAIDAARRARSFAYAPYSQYRVGAAIVTAGERIYAGCNVENATFGATICAERSAVCAMVAAGDKDPVACVVVTRGPTPGTPCGICRQVLAEFARDMDLLLLAEDDAGKIVRRASAKLHALFPHSFRF
ncbi:MAG TPA: cytidine deaminase [Polyangiaceae bacterium]